VVCPSDPGGGIGTTRRVVLTSETVKAAARAVGFAKVGIARVEVLDPGPLDHMLALGAQADMAWLGAQRDKRIDPAKILPRAKSVVVLALGYSGCPDGSEETQARVARYARGRDYHAVMKKKLAKLSGILRECDPEIGLFASADTAPVMEKAWAERAGLGWVGKNGCLVTTDMGSWVLLATLLVDRELEADPPHPRRCGDCEACLGACPTGAIVEPGLVDARQCISYQTIERRGSIPEEVAERSEGWIFGCDECQLACPWNKQVVPSADPELLPRPGQSSLDLDEMLRLTPDDYGRRFYGTSLARARYEGLLRNAVLAAGRSGDSRYVERIRFHEESPFPGVRDAARWALSRLLKSLTAAAR
jgi:epoxyqueuosine reductase